MITDTKLKELQGFLRLEWAATLPNYSVIHYLIKEIKELKQCNNI